MTDVAGCRFVLAIFVAITVGACDDSGPTDPGIPEWDGNVEVDPPDPVSLTPCPAGWAEVAPESEHDVATCEPWPDGHPVALPVLTPCPDGWREVDSAEEHGVATCEPWPTGPLDCADDEAHFPGEAECSLIGQPCPDGRWADDLPTDGATIVYVAAGEPAGGDGTEASPFGSIAEAMSVAGTGTIIALSRGTFDEAVEARSDVTLWGACVAETEVTTSTGRDATISIDQPNVVLRNLRISGAYEGIAARDAGSVEVRDVLVAGAASNGVSIQRDAVLTGRGLVVRDTRSIATGTRGYGLAVRYGARAELERVVLADNLECGLRVTDEGTVAELANLAIRGTLSNGGAIETRGATVEQGGSLTATAVVIEENEELGLYVGDPGTSVTLTDCVVRDTGATVSGARGYGIYLNADAAAQVTRALIERNRTHGLILDEAGASVTLNDSVVRDTLSNLGERVQGHGLFLRGGTEADVARVFFARNRAAAVYVTGEAAELRMQDVVVRDTLPQELTDGAGRGLHVQNGGRAEMISAVLERNIENGVSVESGAFLRMSQTVIRDTVSPASTQELGSALYVDTTAEVEVDVALFERSQDAALYVRDMGTTVTLRDVVVRHTDSRPLDGRGGEGLTVIEGGAVDAVRALIDENREAGIYVSRDARVVLADVLVRATEGRRDDLGFGRGLQVESGASASGQRIAFVGNRGAGVLGVMTGTSVVLEHVVVRDTRQRECWPTFCDEGFGNGVVSVGGAQVELWTFLVAANAMCGLQVAHGIAPGGAPYDVGGTMDLQMGEVAHNEVCGVNVQVVPFELGRLTDSVIYHDNGQNLDTTSLPVPDSDTALAP